MSLSLRVGLVNVEKITVDDVEPYAFSEGSDRRELSDPLDTTNLAINRYRLAPGEGFPGEFQSGRNESDGELVAFGMGAPRDSEDVRIPLECPACGHADLRLDVGEAGPTFVCPDCDTEHVPRDCPACGHDDLRVALREETRTVVVCGNCGTEFDDPPLRD